MATNTVWQEGLERQIKAYADMYWDQLDNSLVGMLDAVESINPNDVIGKGTKARQLAADYDPDATYAAYRSGLESGRIGFESLGWED